METIQTRCGETQAVSAQVKAWEIYLTKSKASIWSIAEVICLLQ